MSHYDDGHSHTNEEIRYVLEGGRWVPVVVNYKDSFVIQPPEDPPEDPPSLEDQTAALEARVQELETLGFLLLE